MADTRTLDHDPAHAAVGRAGHTAETGPAYQGHCKAFPSQTDEHLLTGWAVERKPLQAELIAQTQDRRWSYLQTPIARKRGVSGPPWRSRRAGRRRSRPHCTTPMIGTEVERRRDSVNQETPFGNEAGVPQTEHQSGLEASLNPRGRSAVSKHQAM